MFDAESRYAHLETLELETPDGRTIKYVRRRLVPSADSYQVAGHVGVTDSDRLDVVTHRHLGVPTAYWQVADANEAVHPSTLMGRAGTALAIPLPRHPGAGG